MNIKNLKHVNEDNFMLISGPCAIENEDMAFEICEKISSFSDQFKIPFVFKGSFKKANRSRLDSFTGIGDETALEILKKVGNHYGVPTITDIHLPSDCNLAKDYVDLLQIPAFLARQTDLLLAAGQTGLPINIKKGQFMGPQSMEFAVEKVKSTGNNNVLLTERGTMFGYQDLVVDFRYIPIMKSYAPTILDVTHSLQRPNQSSGVTGGNPELIETIAKAGIAVGVDGVFIETHFDPKNAKSDRANMLHLNNLENLLEKLLKINL
tara:strand:- start:668 stop:1462 length:795 start_codon:yes stop_codon:yes gene_type:complete